jgi:hypothetical protein
MSPPSTSDVSSLSTTRRIPLSIWNTSTGSAPLVSTRRSNDRKSDRSWISVANRSWFSVAVPTSVASS